MNDLYFQLVIYPNSCLHVYVESPPMNPNQGPPKSLSKIQSQTACCWNCNDFFIGKTKRRLHDRKTEHFKYLTKNDHSSPIADHITVTGHNII